MAQRKRYTALMNLDITVDHTILAVNLEEALIKAKQVRMSELDMTFPWNDGSMKVEGVIVQEENGGDIVPTPGITKVV